MYIFIVQFFGFLCYYCNNGSLIIFMIFAQLFLQFYVLGEIFEHPMTPYNISIIILYCIASFVIYTMLAQLIIQIGRLHSKLKTAICENTKLLDGMHEGLLILSKDKTIMFCNKPAKKLLIGAVNSSANLGPEIKKD